MKNKIVFLDSTQKHKIEATAKFILLLKSRVNISIEPNFTPVRYAIVFRSCHGEEEWRLCPRASSNPTAICINNQTGLIFEIELPRSDISPIFQNSVLIMTKIEKIRIFLLVYILNHL